MYHSCQASQGSGGLLQRDGGCHKRYVSWKYSSPAGLSHGRYVAFGDLCFFLIFFFLANEDDLISALWNLALSLSFSHTFFLSFAIFLLNQLSSYRFLSAVEETSTPSASSDIVLQCLRDLSLQTSEGSSPDLAHQLSDRLMQAAQQVAVAWWLWVDVACDAFYRLTFSLNTPEHTRTDFLLSRALLCSSLLKTPYCFVFLGLGQI